MDIPWHQFTGSDKSLPITQTGLTEKASVIGRTGLMMLSCGTGAWRVRSSMNSLATLLGVTCTADIGLMSIEYTCFDGTDCYSQSLCLTNTGVNTSKLNRLERFVNDFDHECCTMTGEQIHTYLDQIEQIHGLYSPFALGCASALACSAFTFLLGGGPIEMLCAFFGAGIGNYLRCKLTKHHFTLFLCIAASVSSACLVYAGLLKIAELLWGISIQHEAGYICAMLFIIPGFPFITSGSRDRRHCKYIPVRTCGSSRNTFRGRCIFRCTDRWTARIPFKKPCRLSKDCDHRSIYRYHGSRIIPVPRDLQSRHHVFGCIGLLVCLCDPYHRMPASRTDLCKNTDR